MDRFIPFSLIGSIVRDSGERRATVILRDGEAPQLEPQLERTHDLTRHVPGC